MVELDPKLDLKVGSLEEETPLCNGVHQIPFVAGTSVAQDGRAPIWRQCTELLLLCNLVGVPPALPCDDSETKKNERMLSGLA